MVEEVQCITHPALAGNDLGSRDYFTNSIHPYVIQTMCDLYANIHISNDDKSQIAAI